MTRDPYIAFMLRIGRLKVNNLGVFRLRETVSKNGKIHWSMWYCVFTGTPEHIRAMPK